MKSFLEILKQLSKIECFKDIQNPVVWQRNIRKERKLPFRDFSPPALDKKKPLDMEKIRQEYALKRNDFAPFHELLKDTPPAQELTKRLSK